MDASDFTKLAKDQDPRKRWTFFASMKTNENQISIRHMKVLTTVLSTMFLAVSGSVFATTTTDVFTGFTMDFVEVANPGNAADDTGYGAVNYAYRIGKYEVSRGMIEAYNISRGLSPAITMYDFDGESIENLADRPATGLSWNEAARFVNWLNTSRGFHPAYKFLGAGGNDNISVWDPWDAGYDESNPYRNSKAQYFLPSENEWYKAAYYYPGSDSASAGYWDFATGSDSKPAPINSGTTSGTVVYRVNTFPAVITEAGGLSPYGTMAQNGNANEWTESADNAPNNSPNLKRVMRGGDWFIFEGLMESSNSIGLLPDVDDGGTIGFRVASVLEPSGDWNGEWGPVSPFLRYALNSEGTGYEVTGLDDTVSGKVVIPASYNGKPVTSIRQGVFKFRDQITDIVCPGTILEYDSFTFANMPDLLTITISEGTLKINYLLADGCRNLDTVYLPDSLDVLGGPIVMPLSTAGPDGFNYDFGPQIIFVKSRQFRALELWLKASSERDAAVLERDQANAAYDAAVEERDRAIAERDARFTMEQIKDARVGSTMVEVSGGKARITMDLEESSDLSNWTNATTSKKTIEVDAPAGVRFYRFKMKK